MAMGGHRHNSENIITCRKMSNPMLVLFLTMALAQNPDDSATTPDEVPEVSDFQR